MNGTKDGTHRQDPVDLIAGFSHVFVLRRPGGILVTVLRGSNCNSFNTPQ